MPEETLTLEQELEQFKTANTPAPPESPAVPATPAATETPAPPTPETTAAPETPVEPTLEDKLKAIEDAPAEPPKPVLTDAQQQVLAIVPTVESLNELRTAANQLGQLSDKLSRRDFAGFESMLDTAALTDFHEYVYQKFVAPKDSEWVARWIAEHEGRGGNRSEIKRLETEIANLRQAHEQRQTSEQQREQAAATQRIQQSYNSHLTSLFDKIEFSKDDRRYVAADIKMRVESNPAVLNAIYSGNVAAVNKIFKEAVTEFSSRGKAAAVPSTPTDATKHKPLVGGNPVVQLTSLPDNINEVPKGREDDWMMEQLTKLGAATGRRK